MSERRSIADAELAGLVVNRPDNYTLQLDLDDAAAEEHYEANKWMLWQYYDFVSEKRTTSKSGNTHVYITMGEPLPVLERILLQAVLGSDRKREFLSYRNVLDGKSDPVVLFELPPRRIAAPKTENAR